MARAALGLCPDEADFYRYLQRLSRHPDEAVRKTVMGALAPRPDMSELLPVTAGLSAPNPTGSTAPAVAEALVLACTVPGFDHGTSPLWLPPLPLPSVAAPRLVEALPDFTPAGNAWLRDYLSKAENAKRMPLETRRQLISAMVVSSTDDEELRAWLGKVVRGKPESQWTPVFIPKVMLSLYQRESPFLKRYALDAARNVKDWKAPEYAEFKDALLLGLVG